MEKGRKINIAILTNVIPAYREGFYNRLFDEADIFVKVYCQEKVKGVNYKTIHHKYPKNVELVDFIAVSGEKIVWQFIPFLKIMSEYDIIFVDGNPRIVSQALFATLLKLLGKKVVVWSMVHSHRNMSLSESIRINWLKLFEFHFLYNDLDITKLNEYGGFEKKVLIGMNNGLDQKKIDTEIKKWDYQKLEQWRVNQKIDNRTIIISSGRIITKNKYELIIQALIKLIVGRKDILWCIIGDGPERSLLELIVKEKEVENYVRFVGECYDESILCPWFLSSQIFIHPAAIGLSILHAFGYGLPVITHNNKSNHGPEYVAFEAGKTGVNFKEDNSNDLAISIDNLLSDESLLKNIKGNVQAIAREKYNNDIMVSRFLEMIRKVENK